MTQEGITPQWSEENSQTFIDYGHYFIPERELQIETICSLVPVIPGQQHILDLGCGEGVLCHALLERFPTYHVHGLDGSAMMVEKATASLQSYGERFEARIGDLASAHWHSLAWPLHAVVSSLAIHHLDDAQKWQLFRSVKKMLSPGGVFIIADVIQPISPEGIAVAGKMWEDAVRERALQFGGNLNAYQHFHDMQWNSFTLSEPDPMDKMAPLFDQLNWLREVGFIDVDVFWMKAGHAIFGGRRQGVVS